MNKRNKSLVNQKLGLGYSRGETFVGFRPVKFKDKTKYDRAIYKARLRKEKQCGQ